MNKLDFISRVGGLKELKREGWRRFGLLDGESVADHSFRVAIMCMLYAKEAGVDEDRAVKMALVHDIHEVESGDIVTRYREEDQDVSNAEKERLERLGFEKLLGKLPGNTELRELWEEAFEKKTPTALFVDEMDKLEMILQALDYRKAGRDEVNRFFRSAERSMHSAKAKRMYRKIKSEFEGWLDEGWKG